MGTKGGGFEWDVCRALSKWLTHGKDDGQLVRSRSSGAWATVRAKQKKSGIKTQLGDIAAAGPEAHENVNLFLSNWFVECKAYKDEPNLYALFRCEDECKAKLVQWWIKATEQAYEANHRSPMLIVKRNRQPILVVTEHGLDAISDIRMRITWTDYDFVMQPFADMLAMDELDFLKWAHYG